MKSTSQQSEDKQIMVPLWVPFIVGIASFMVGLFLSMVADRSGYNKATEEWREASKPVFEARRMSTSYASNATPRDLARALNANVAMTMAEGYKLTKEWQDRHLGTQIIIAPTSEEWARLK